MWNIQNAHFSSTLQENPVFQHISLGSILTWLQKQMNQILMNFWTSSEKKTGLGGENPQAGDPPPPVWETPVIKKKVGFIFHFRTSGTVLVFTKKSPFWVIDWNYVVGIGEPPLRDARFLHFPQKENIVKC